MEGKLRDQLKQPESSYKAKSWSSRLVIFTLLMVALASRQVALCKIRLARQMDMGVASEEA